MRQLLLPLQIDNVAPQLAASAVVTRVLLGRTARVLAGTALDGGTVADVSVRIQPPLGEPYRRDVLRSDSDWFYDFTGEAPGLYRLWVDAMDGAGNRTSSGPYGVEVTCTGAAVSTALRSIEPIQGTPITLTLTAAVSNAGPETAPAGLPVRVFANGAPAGAVTTTQLLAPGQSEALSLLWAPEGPGSYDVGLAAGDSAAGPPPAQLCQTPETSVETVAVQDVALYSGWNLVNAGQPAGEPGDRRGRAAGPATSYAVIESYDKGRTAYYPGNPAQSTLKTMEQRHGYWVRARRCQRRRLIRTSRPCRRRWRRYGPRAHAARR